MNKSLKIDFLFDKEQLIDLLSVYLNSLGSIFSLCSGLSRFLQPSGTYKKFKSGDYCLMAFISGLPSASTITPWNV